MKLQLVPLALLLALASACDRTPDAPAASVPVASVPDSKPAATPAADPAAPSVASVAATPAVAPQTLSAEACAPEAYADFFNDYAGSPGVRAAYTADTVRVGSLDKPAEARPVAKADYRDFRVGIVDSRWAYLDPAIKDPGSYPLLDLEFKPEGGKSFRVEYIQAEFDADDNVVKTIGKRAAYVFERGNDCWVLSQDLH